MPHKRLFIPGPTEVRSENLAAMARPQIGHRGDEFHLPGEAGAGTRACGKRRSGKSHAARSIVSSSDSAEAAPERAWVPLKTKKGTPLMPAPPCGRRLPEQQPCRYVSGPRHYG